MICTKDNCDKKYFCEEVHNLNGYKLNVDEVIIIPNRFYFELNMGNRLAKRGIPNDGFEFGCMKLLESENECGSLYINNTHITNFEFTELLDSCNSAFSEMVRNGDIKIR